MEGQYLLGASEFTLPKKREYVALPACQDALRLLRAGVAKPLRFPRPDLDTEDNPAYPCLRDLARLVSAAIYVACADGRTESAVRLASDTVTFAYPLKESSVLSGLVGVAVEATVLSPLVKLRDCWSAADCQRLIRMMEQSLAKPDRTQLALSAERENSLRIVAAWRDNWGKVCDTLEQRHEPFEDSPEPPQYQKSREYAAVLRTDPATRERVSREMADVIAEQYDHAMRLLGDPTGRMMPFPNVTTGTTRHPMIPLLSETFLPDARKAVQRSVMGRVNLQLVAVHAAIRAFRWETDRLPKSLDELALGANLRTDPFTKKPLLYEPEKTGTDYDLASAGALFPGEKGKLDARERITFPWTRPK